MSSPTDNILDLLQTAVESYLSAQSPTVAAPDWFRENAGTGDLDASTHRIHFKRTRAVFGPPRKVGGTARGRVGRSQTVEAEIRGDTYEDAELLLDALAWALREKLGTAERMGAAEWLPTDPTSRGCAVRVAFTLDFLITDPPLSTATTEHVAESGALE